MASLAERETIFRVDYATETVHVWSNAPTVWTKLARLGVPVAKQTNRSDKREGRFYTFPLDAFKWRYSKAKRRGGPGNVATLEAARAKGGAA